MLDILTSSLVSFCFNLHWFREPHRERGSPFTGKSCSHRHTQTHLWLEAAQLSDLMPTEQLHLVSSCWSEDWYNPLVTSNEHWLVFSSQVIWIILVFRAWSVFSNKLNVWHTHRSLIGLLRYLQRSNMFDIWTAFRQYIMMNSIIPCSQVSTQELTTLLKCFSLCL